MAPSQIQRSSLLLGFDLTTGKKVMNIIAQMRNSVPAVGQDEIRFLSVFAQVVDIHNLNIGASWSRFKGR